MLVHACNPSTGGRGQRQMDPWSSLYSQLASEPQAWPETLSQKIRQRAIKEDYQNQPLTPRCMCTQVIYMQTFTHIICVQAFTHAYKHMWTPHIHKDTYIQNEKKKKAWCSMFPHPHSMFLVGFRTQRGKEKGKHFGKDFNQWLLISPRIPDTQ